MGRKVNMDPTIKEKWFTVVVIKNQSYRSPKIPLEEMQEWCQTAIPGRFAIGNKQNLTEGSNHLYSYDYCFFFRSKRDAVIFKMTWAGITI